MDNNAEILREYLQPHEVQFIQEVCSRYIVNKEEEEEEEDSKDSYELEYAQSESTIEEDPFDKNVKTDMVSIVCCLFELLPFLLLLSLLLLIFLLVLFLL